MHLLTDENGNPIAHGDHHHEHEHLHEHDHATSHDHHHAEPYTDRSQALLVYMFDHNVHHTLELLDVASKIEKELGWKPKYDLECIVSSAWKWHQKVNSI